MAGIGSQAQAHLAQFLRQRASWRDASDAGIQCLSELCNAVLQLSFYDAEDSDARSIEIRRRQVSHADPCRCLFPLIPRGGCVLRCSMPAPSLNATELRCLFSDCLKRYVSSLRPVLTPTCRVFAAVGSCLLVMLMQQVRVVRQPRQTHNTCVVNRWPCCRCASCGIMQHVFVRFVHQASNRCCHTSCVVLRCRRLSR